MLERLRPHRVARSLVELKCEEFLARGVRGVILDLDNTLTAWRSVAVSPEIERWIGRLRDAGLAVCVVSNAATARRVRPVADRLGLPWVTRAGKPLARGFLRGMRLMGTEPSTTAMVGDQLFTDILGGNSLGLFTVLVDPISTREAITTKWLQRPLERLVGRVPKEFPPSNINVP
jgi:HAD superfamily phosphatase (TIGR01668 family)